MKKIAIITSNYMPNPDANGICAYNIINELKKNSDDVVCICSQQEGEKTQETIDGVKLFRIAPAMHMRAINQYLKHPSWKNKRKMSVILTVRRCKNLLNIIRYPRTEIKRENLILSVLDQMHEFDLIIAIFRPFEGMGAAIAYKKKHPNCQICGYFLDSLINFVPRGINPQIYRKITLRNEEKYLKRLDIILKPESDERYYKKGIWNDKIAYVKFPVFVKANSSAKYKFADNELSLVFIGTLDSAYRSPAYLLKVLQQLHCNGTSARFHFFGTYDNSVEMTNWEKEYKDFFSSHGRISYQMSRTVLANADILVNITNKNLEMVPSKVYELMAQGKPILNVNSNRNDSCEKYFASYPLVCNINAAEGNIEKDSGKIKNFLETQIIHPIDYQQIYSDNYKATPEYVSELIRKKYFKIL